DSQARSLLAIPWPQTPSPQLPRFTANPAPSSSGTSSMLRTPAVAHAGDHGGSCLFPTPSWFWRCPAAGEGEPDAKLGHASAHCSEAGAGSPPELAAFRAVGPPPAPTPP
ncbi:unnamed protein product, partial [Ectocarpus sp. 8 AP-2014]